MQSIEEKLVDSLEFLLPSLLAIKKKYSTHQILYPAIQTVVFAIATLVFFVEYPWYKRLIRPELILEVSNAKLDSN